MRNRALVWATAAAFALVGCKKFGSQLKEDDTTAAIRMALPGGLVETVVAKEKILDVVVPGDGTNGVPPSMNGVWWTNAVSVHFVVSFKNAVWHPDTKRASILLTGPYTYSRPSRAKGETVGVEGVSQVAISTGYSGYDIEFNDAGDFGNLLVASSDGQGNRSARDAGYTMDYVEDGHWVRHTRGSPDYHIRRIYNGDGTINTTKYQMTVNKGNGPEEMFDTPLAGYLADSGMGKLIAVDLPVDGIPASGGSKDITIDPNAAQTFLAVTGGAIDLRGVVSVSPNYDGTLYVQTTRGGLVCGDSSGQPTTTCAKGAKSVVVDIGAKGVIALKSPSNSNQIVTLTFTPIVDLKLDEKTPLTAVPLVAGAPETHVILTPQDDPQGLYQVTTTANFPARLSLTKADYYGSKTPLEWETPQTQAQIIKFGSGSESMKLTITLPPGSPGGQMNLTLTPLAQTATVNNRGTAAVGAVISGTLSSINAVDTYQITGLSAKSADYSLVPKLVRKQLNFDVNQLRTGVAPLDAAFIHPNRYAGDISYLRLDSSTWSTLIVTYSGPFNMANPNLNYSFGLTPRAKNVLTLPAATQPIETQ